MYEWEYWLDHVTNPSNVFMLEDMGGGLVRLTLAGTVMQQGTPQDQAHFNNIESGIVDAHAASALLLNFARQIGWTVEDILAYLGKVKTIYTGTKNLTNSLEFPFNDSRQSVSIGAALDNTVYEIQTRVTASVGNVGEVEITDKLINGFKLSYTGSAPSATIAWVVIPQTAAAAF